MKLSFEKQTIVNRKSTKRKINALSTAVYFFVFIMSMKCAWALMLRVKLIKREVGDFQGEYEVSVKVIEIYSRVNFFYNSES